MDLTTPPFTAASPVVAPRAQAYPVATSRAVLLLAMTLVLLVAAFARLHHLTLQSLWFDEAFAWNIVRQPDMFPRIAADTHPPLYYLFLRGWVTVTGESVLALRYLSALFGLLTVAVVYAVGREAVRLRRWDALPAAVPVMAALLLALADSEIDLAQEARNYTLQTLLAVLSMWGYLRWLRGKRGWLWVAATAALMYTHYYGVFIPAAQGLHALLWLRGRRRVMAVAHLAAAGLIFLPWFLAVTVPQAQNAVENSLPFSIPSDRQAFLDLRRNFLTQQWALVLTLALLGSLGLRNGQRDRPGYGGAALLLLWVLVPVLVLWFGNYAAALLTHRKMAIIAPALALLVAFGLGRLRQPAAGLLLAALVVYGAFHVDFYRLKEPWAAVAADAARYAGPNDIALIEVGNGQYPMTYYWERTLPDSALVTGFPVLADPTMAPTTDWFTFYDGLVPQLLDFNQAERVGPVATVWLAWWWREEPARARLEAAGYVRTMTTTHVHLGNAIDLYRYDHLPVEPAARYANGMTLHAVEIVPDSLRVDLWWSAQGSESGRLDRDYVTSALLLDANGALAAQMDSPPFMGQRPTTTWEPGAVVFDPKALQLPEGVRSLAPGTYTVVVQVYAFGGDGIEQITTRDGERWYVAGVLNVPE